MVEVQFLQEQKTAYPEHKADIIQYLLFCMLLNSFTLLLMLLCRAFFI